MEHILEAYVDTVGGEQHRREKETAGRAHRQPEREAKMTKRIEMIVLGHEQTEGTYCGYVFFVLF